MFEAALAMLPFALAGAFLPTWTRDVMVLLATKRPIANSVAYILGNLAFRLALGVTVLLAVAPAMTFDHAVGRGAIDPTVELLTGLALLALSAAVLLRRSSAIADTVPRWLRALERVPVWLSFCAGLGFVALPGVQYVYFLGGLGALGQARLPAAQSMILLLAFCTFLELMLAAPVVAYAVMPERSAAIIGAFKRWLGRNARPVSAAILAAVGAFLVVAAVRGSIAG